MPDAAVEAFFPGTTPFRAPAGASRRVRRALGALRRRLRYYRARSTWRSYLPLWRRAWDYCAAELQHEGAEQSVAALAARPHIAYAYAQDLSEETAAKTTVAAACTAINFAMRLNGQKAIMNDFAPEMLRDVLKRQRDRPRQAMEPMSAEQTTGVLQGWGWAARRPWQRQMALLMAMSRGLLGRFSDMAQIQVKGIVFYPEGVMVCIPLRKNRHGKGYAWLPLADSGGSRSTVALLRDHLRKLGYRVPTPAPEGARVGAGSARLDAFLFRGLRRCSSRTHIMHTDYTLGDGSAPASTLPDAQGYKVTLQLWRRALRECCNLTEAQAARYGTHSGRRGGDTALFSAGVPQDVRMLMGMWLTPSTELGYVEFDARQRLSWAAACTV